MDKRAAKQVEALMLFLLKSFSLATKKKKEEEVGVSSQDKGLIVWGQTLVIDSDLGFSFTLLSRKEYNQNMEVMCKKDPETLIHVIISSRLYHCNVLFSRPPYKDPQTADSKCCCRNFHLDKRDLNTSEQFSDPCIGSQSGSELTLRCCYKL